MKQASRLLIVLLLVSVFAVLSYANSANKGDEYGISIAPSTLVLSSQVKCVSVHSNIPFALVEADSIALEGAAPYLVKSDDMGDLVAKFNVDDIAAVVTPGKQELILVCIVDGEEICVSDHITVKE